MYQYFLEKGLCAPCTPLDYFIYQENVIYIELIIHLLHIKLFKKTQEKVQFWIFRKSCSILHTFFIYLCYDLFVCNNYNFDI